MAKSKDAESKRGKQNARPTNKSPIHKEVAATLKRLEKQDPGLKKFLDDAYGYAVFPSVGKAAVVVGGAYGRGVVFEQGEPIGFATMGQLTLGVQLGGDTFSEVIAFESKESLDRFKKGRMAFAANASAVLVKAGAAATTNFEKGVATFVYAEGGMMLELAIGGQRFKFKSAEEGEEDEGGGGGGGAEQGEGSGMTGLAGRAVGGAKQLLGGAGRVVGAKQLLGGAKRVAGGAGSAASKAKELAKGHPVAAALVGTGVAAGAVMAVRALRGASGAKASGGGKGGAEQRRRPGAEEDGSVGGGGKRDASEERPSSRQQKQGGGSSRGGSAGRGQASRARR